MQKFNDPCIKTGDFAKLCNTNKRTLIHYDEIGLFSPAYTDEKGYRFYTERQCDTFFTITCLKELGMPLKEIRKYIERRDPSDLKALLLEQQQNVRLEQVRLQKIERVIQTKLDLLTSGEQLCFSTRYSPVTIETHPEEYLVASPLLNTNDHEKLFTAICQHITYCNKNQLNIGHPYGAMLPVSSLKAGNTDTYAYFIRKVDAPPASCEYLVKPAGQYAVIYLKGDYYDADEAFRRLFAYMEQNRLSAGKFCYKEAIWDEMTVEKEEDYITRISIPV